MRVRYVTKGGEVFNESFPLMEKSFQQWFDDVISNECGMFPYPKGRISVDALLAIEEVTDER